ncbi:unknown [Prevotella sp. CAG:1124]|nr:unknown [Prevotella sp. CAG:1124]
MRKTTNDKLKSRQKSTFRPLKACVWTAFTNITEYRILHK